MERRVVITGLGVVSPVGTGVEKFWNSLLEGKSGIAPITRFDAADFVFDVVGVQDEFLYACLVGEGMITITAYIKSNRQKRSADAMSQ